MTGRVFFGSVIVGFWLLGTPALAADPNAELAEKIRQVINRPEYGQSHWGILVADAKTGEPLFAKNPEKLFTPASTTKLYSCAAALTAFGANHRFVTPVYAIGKIDDGELQGDLILVGRGDFTLGGRTKPDGTLAFRDNDHTYANSGLGEAELTDTDPVAGLNELAKQVKKAGIKRIRGEVKVDDRFFPPGPSSGSGPDFITSVMVNDNVLDLIISPGDKPGEPAKFQIKPETEYYQIDFDVMTGKKDSGTSVTLEPVGTRQFMIRGSIAVNAKPTVRIYPVDDPNSYSRTLFIEALRRNGIRVDAPLARLSNGGLPPLSVYEDLEPVAKLESLPFSELIKVILKVSHNLYASGLPILLATKAGKRTQGEGLVEQGKLLKELGVDAETISFGGGAGGAQADCITPRATVQLLQGMAKQPYWEQFKAGLPSLGVDGTLASSVASDSPAKGKVSAKTGTLIWFDFLNGQALLRSKALAGTTTTASGREVHFAIFVNDVHLPKGVTSKREGEALGEIAEMIYLHAK